MKITKKILENLIKEELSKIINEAEIRKMSIPDGDPQTVAHTKLGQMFGAGSKEDLFNAIATIYSELIQAKQYFSNSTFDNAVDIANLKERLDRLDPKGR